MRLMSSGRLYFNEFSKSLFIPDGQAAYPRRQNFVMDGLIGIDDGQNISLQAPGLDGSVRLEMFGGGVGVENNVPAFNAAIAAGYRTIVLGPGVYNCTAPLVIDGVDNICLRSARWMNLNSVAELRYAGAGTSASFISARGTNAFTADRLRITAYPSTGSFTGRLVDLRGTARPSALINMVGCAFHVEGKTGTLLSLANTYNCTFRDLLLQGCDVGILGTEGGSDFANAMTFENLTFASFQCTTCLVKNPGQAWSITGSSFEPLVNGSANGVESVTIASGFHFANNWCGDAIGSVEGSWIKGCFFGAVIIGNNFQTYTNVNIDAVYLGAGAAGCEGVIVEGNSFSGNSASLRAGVRYETSPVPRKVRQSNNSFYLVTAGLDPVPVRAEVSAGQALPDVTYTLVTVTGSGFNVDGTYTVTAPGRYALAGLVELAQVSGWAQCGVFKGSGAILVSRGLRAAFAGAGLTPTSISDVVELSVGDVIGLYVYPDYGVPSSVFTARFSVTPER